MKKCKKICFSLLLSIAVVMESAVSIEASTLSMIPNLNGTSYSINNVFTVSGYKG